MTNETAGKIVNAEFSKFNEAWLSQQINDEDYLFYIVKVLQSDNDRILSVALKKRDLSFSLFDFFKVFFIHSLIIIAFVLIFLTVGVVKNPTIKFTFRTQILTAFLVIAIIPLLLLAAYFRSITEERNTEAVVYELGKKARNVENYINEYTGSSTINSKSIYEKAAKDLNVNFSLYEDKYYLFSSNSVYFKIGFIPQLINPRVYTELLGKDASELVLEEKIENFLFHSYYHKITIGNEKYIIKVSDAFNPLQLSMSSSQLDIFLFGSYSLAVILIIILSTLIANQISRPVRRLTSATQSIAGGDLSVQIENTNKGEIKDLISGFNFMVKELKRSQNKLAEVEREAAWREMAKQVAHEIKNPLTPMKLAIQQLKASYEDKSPKFQEIFQKVTGTIIQQIEILKNIASEFSSFARMPTPKLENVDFNKVLNETANLFVDEKVTINIQTAGNVSVYADPDQLKRIVINLIRNSIQADASAIKLILDEDAGNILFRITDNGKGINSENYSKIFESDFTTKEQGMGLGLSMAKRFVESIGAEIKVEFSSPAGTTILIIFPKSH